MVEINKLPRSPPHHQMVCQCHHDIFTFGSSGCSGCYLAFIATVFKIYIESFNSSTVGHLEYFCFFFSPLILQVI